MCGTFRSVRETIDNVACGLALTSGADNCRCLLNGLQFSFGKLGCCKNGSNSFHRRWAEQSLWASPGVLHECSVDVGVFYLAGGARPISFTESGPIKWLAVKTWTFIFRPYRKRLPREGHGEGGRNKHGCSDVVFVSRDLGPSGVKITSFWFRKVFNILCANSSFGFRVRGPYKDPPKIRVALHRSVNLPTPSSWEMR